MTNIVQNLTIIDKCTDCVLEIRIQDLSMWGEDKSTELLQPPLQFSFLNQATGLVLQSFKTHAVIF